MELSDAEKSEVIAATAQETLNSPDVDLVTGTTTQQEQIDHVVKSNSENYIACNSQERFNSSIDSVGFLKPVDTRMAVQSRRVRLSYGQGKRATHVLNGMNMEVPEGVIYGLLGPSGCGKTTLLRCIVGRLIPNEGELLVLGCKPSSKESSVPGPGIGYMPQDLALHPEFTIHEILWYFGRLQGLHNDIIKERTEFLIKMLDLPEEKKLIRNLSGGQQRRVSFAVALIHKPPLLILDEPTVGVDPILRSSIWSHLVTLSTQEKITIIITTHYVEEACQANIVGLMRAGRLLAEECPKVLMQKMNQPSLEGVFLSLCARDLDKELDQKNDEVILSNIYNEQTEVDRAMYNQNIESMSHSTFNLIHKGSSDLTDKRVPGKPIDCFKDQFLNDFTKVSTVFLKNWIRISRNVVSFVFNFVLPALQMFVFCVCVGQDPFGLTIAVVNQETQSNLSQIFLQKIDTHTLIQQPFNDLTLAKESVEKAINWGVLHIGENFSVSLYERFNMGLSADNETIDAGTIKVYLDMSNQQIGFIIKKVLLETLQKFGEEILNMGGFNRTLPSLPLSIEEPLLGSRRTTFIEFVAPGILLSIAYFMAKTQTSLIFVRERKSGISERSWVSGVTANHVFIAQVLTTFFILLVQVAILLIMSFYIFNIPSRGPIFWIMLLTILQGVCGMSVGLVLSAICDEERTAVGIAQGLFVPNIFISGIIWPLPAMPHALRSFSFYMPQTAAVEAARSILSRGWGVEYKIVWSAIVISISWTTVALVAAVILFRYRKL